MSRLFVGLLTIILASCGGSGGGGSGAQDSPCGNVFLDQAHCGSCDVICPTGSTCEQGQCVCPTGLSPCSSGCVDLQNNLDHCGQCEEACGSNQECVAGQCACPDGQQDCDGACIDVQTNANHCGGCGQSCAQGARCDGAQCVCRPGTALCGDVCVNVESDEANCGGCGVQCPEDAVCEESVCACRNSRETLCDDLCVQTDRDLVHCGQCDNACIEGQTCDAGRCVCEGTGEEVCGGACVDLRSSPVHCGECDNGCDEGQVCQEGACACPGLTTECDGQCVDIRQDEAHCGQCGQACDDGLVCCGGQCAQECDPAAYDLDCPQDLTVEPGILPGGLDAYQIPFELSGQVRSFLMVPFVEDGVVRLESLQTPNGETLGVRNGDYSFATLNQNFLDRFAPLMVPQAPQFADVVTEGSYILTVGAQEPPCRLLMTTTVAAERLDLNVYLVGLNGLEAANAADDAALTQMLQTLESRLAEIGVEPQVVRFVDIEGQDAERYRIVRSEDAALELVALSQDPGLDAQARLSLNVFIIRQFSIMGGGGLVGLSLGLPGAAGLHGTPSSGVIIADLREDPSLMSKVLAHELGHYLGLFHTSEVLGTSFDPLADTGRCERQQWNDPERCPDIDNLMFPAVSPTSEGITPDQRSVILSNPLIKVAPQ